jgi:hypothetical protein
MEIGGRTRKRLYLGLKGYKEHGEDKKFSDHNK